MNICKFCGDNRKSLKSKVNHERLCKQNPNRQILDTSNARKMASKPIICEFCNDMFQNNTISKHQKACIKNPENENRCLVCDALIPVKSKYCSSSCSAKSNNLLRGSMSEEVKAKISNSLKGRPCITTNRKDSMVCKIQFSDCSVCGKTFYVRNNFSYVRKTCSRDCSVVASVGVRKYRNGTRKHIWYFNRNQNKEVLLESSWELELAEFLDENKIHWIRPKHIKWIDKDSTERLYFPDFYLKDYDLFLDPKNPYCMEQDMYKMNCISNIVNIMYGDIKEMISNLRTVVRFPGP